MQIPAGCLSGYLDEQEYAVFSKQSELLNMELIRLIAQMYQVYEEKKTAYELKVRGLFYQMLYLLVTEFMTKEENQVSLRQKRHLDKLSKITSYMKNNYDQDITLESVAEEFGFSPTYLSRMFKRYADISYKTYLLNLRTEYGLREMMNTDHSLSDVAMNNGFPNSRAFAKAFLKRYGALPSEYRNQMRDVKAGKSGQSAG